MRKALAIVTRAQRARAAHRRAQAAASDAARRAREWSTPRHERRPARRRGRLLTNGGCDASGTKRARRPACRRSSTGACGHRGLVALPTRIGRRPMAQPLRDRSSVARSIWRRTHDGRSRRTSTSERRPFPLGRPCDGITISEHFFRGVQPWIPAQAHCSPQNCRCRRQP